MAVGSAVGLSASAPGGGEITFSINGGGLAIASDSYMVTNTQSFCAVSGSTLTAQSVGDCAVEASIAQDDRYLSATSSTVTFQARTGRTASLSVPSGALLSDGSVDVSATLSDAPGGRYTPLPSPGRPPA